MNFKETFISTLLLLATNAMADAPLWAAAPLCTPNEASISIRGEDFKLVGKKQIFHRTLPLPFPHLIGKDSGRYDEMLWKGASVGAFAQLHVSAVDAAKKVTIPRQSHSLVSAKEVPGYFVAEGFDIEAAIQKLYSVEGGVLSLELGGEGVKKPCAIEIKVEYGH